MELKLITVTEALGLGLVTKGSKTMYPKGEKPVELWTIADKDGIFLNEEKRDGYEPFQNVKLELHNNEVTSIHM